VEEFDDDEEVAAVEIMWGKEPLTESAMDKASQGHV
jgi:hypothetical protein